MLSIFYAVKGGDGASTVAAATAIVSKAHVSTLLIDLAPTDDLATYLGRPRVVEGPEHIAEGLTLERHVDVPSDEQLGAWAGARDIHFVIDLGTLTDPHESRTRVARFGHAGSLVIRPTFASLVHHDRMGISPSRVFMLDGFPGQTIDLDIVKDHIGRCVERIPFDAAVVRSTCSGFLSARIPKGLWDAVWPHVRYVANV